MTLRYEPGTGNAMVRNGTVVVLQEDADRDLVLRMWDQLGQDAGLVEVLQVLTGAFGSRLKTVPPFAVVEVSGRHAQVAVRGALSVSVDVEADPASDTQAERAHIDGLDVTTWSERIVDDVTDLVVRIGVARPDGQLLDDDVTLPLGFGAVRADAVGWRLDDRSPRASLRSAKTEKAAPVKRPPADGDEEFPDETVVSALPPVPLPPVDPAPPAQPRPEADSGVAEETIAPLLEDAPAEPTVLDLVAAPLVLDALDVPAPVIDRIPLDPGVDAILSPVPEPTVLDLVKGAPIPVPGPEVSEPSAEPVAPDAPEPGTDLAEVPQPDLPASAEAPDDDYGHLWGSTVLRTVEDAAVRTAEPDDEANAPAVASGPDTPSAPGVPPAPPASAPPASEPDGGVLAAVPGEWIDERVPTGAHAGTAAHGSANGVLPSGAVPGPASAEDDIDHDGHTVMSSAIAEMRAAALRATPPDAAPGPATDPEGDVRPATAQQQILARTCPDGHANPPSRDMCAVCSAPLTGDAALAVRPPLGRVVLSTGQVVELDRDVVVGRRPRSLRGGSDLPRLITVNSPGQDISRCHVEITLEGWHVLITDLETTNGTRLLRGGQPPRRLHPMEPLLVVDGDIADLGDGITLTFTGLR